VTTTKRYATIWSICLQHDSTLI